MKLNNTPTGHPVLPYIDVRDVFCPQVRQVSWNRSSNRTIQNYERIIWSEHSLISLVALLSGCLNIQVQGEVEVSSSGNQESRACEHVTRKGLLGETCVRTIVERWNEQWEPGLQSQVFHQNPHSGETKVWHLHLSSMVTIASSKKFQGGSWPGVEAKPIFPICHRLRMAVCSGYLDLCGNQLAKMDGSELSTPSCGNLSALECRQNSNSFCLVA